MIRFITHWLITALALAVTDWLLSGVAFRSLVALAIAAIVLGFVNAVVRPLIFLLTLPLTLVTLGLFYFVVNGLAFAFAAFLVPGFEIAGFGSAMLGAIIVSLVSWFVGMFDRGEKRPRGES